MMTPLSTLTLSFELVTPAYAGGADVSETEGLRPPTLKALLRFWWRAMHSAMSSEDLFQAESRIFGSTSIGQGVRIIPCDARALQSETPPPYTPRDRSPLFYMAYGAQGTSKEPRPRLRQGQKVTFRLCGSPRSTEAEWNTIVGSVWLLGAFGGFGTRSRRGFGSLQAVGALPGLPDLSACKSVEALRNKMAEGLRVLIPDVPPKLPEHSAFSRQTRILLGPRSRSWEDALIVAGRVYYEFRRALGTTYNHGPRGEPVGMDFRRIQYYGRRAPVEPTNRATYGAAFGLPQNYQFSGPPPGRSTSHRWNPSVEACHTENLARRASPVLFHVAKLATGEFVPVVLWLRSTFLPEDYQVAFKDGKSLTSLQPVDDRIVTTLLNPGPTDLRNWVNDVEQPPIRFVGYLGRPGWQEVKW